MIFDWLIKKILNYLLKDYFEYVPYENLSFSLFSGKLDLENLKLRRGIFKNHGLPYEIEYSNLKALHVSWVVSSLEVKLSLKDLVIFLTPDFYSKKYQFDALKELFIKSVQKKC